MFELDPVVLISVPVAPISHVAPAFHTMLGVAKSPYVPLMVRSTPAPFAIVRVMAVPQFTVPLITHCYMVSAAGMVMVCPALMVISPFVLFGVPTGATHAVPFQVFHTATVFQLPLPTVW